MQVPGFWWDTSWSWILLSAIGSIPSGGDGIITEDDQPMISEGGDRLVTE